MVDSSLFLVYYSIGNKSFHERFCPIKGVSFEFALAGSLKDSAASKVSLMGSPWQNLFLCQIARKFFAERLTILSFGCILLMKTSLFDAELLPLAVPAVCAVEVSFFS